MPAYSISPEEIFQGNILLFNVDFFNDNKEIKAVYEAQMNEGGTKYINDKGEDVNSIDDAAKTVKYYYYLDDNGNTTIEKGDNTVLQDNSDVGKKATKTSKQDMAQELKGIISKWYVSLRNIAIVAMMIILLYVGIRMLLSTVSSDKAKYKAMIQDWLIGIVILFLMHYIMSFSVIIVEKLTDIISSSVDQNLFMSIIPNDENNKLHEQAREMGLTQFLTDSHGNQADKNDKDVYLFYPSNMLGYIRIRAQLANWGTEYIGYALCFLVMVCFTLYFIFVYLKRFIYMAFLTLMAPLVAATYPIDKISDGNAQGFNKWLKEYIFNLLLQPLHLLLYYILITSAFNLASSNIIYSIVALGFMIPAEKLLRSFFGFEKSNTASQMSAAAGGALAMSAINSLKGLGKGSSGTGNGGAEKAKSDNESDARKPRTEDVDENALFEGDEIGEDNQILDSNDNSDEYSQLDAYDEKYGTDEWDPQERDAIAREENNNPGMQYSDEEYEQILRDSGYSDEEIRELMGGEEEQNNQPANEPTHTSTTTPTPANARPITTTPTGRKRKKITGRRAWRATKSGLISSGAVAGRLVGKAGTKLFRAALAGGIGAAGLAVGIATGDPKNALQSTLAAGGVGLAVGGKMAEMADRKIDEGTDNLWNYKNKMKNSRKYEQLADEDYMFKKEKEAKKLLEANFDKKEVDRMYKDGTIQRYIQKGVDNPEDIVTAERMRQDDSTMSQDKAIVIAKYAKRVGNDYDNTNAGKWRETFADEYKNKKGMNATQADKNARKTMDYVTKFNKTKKSNYK